MGGRHGAESALPNSTGRNAPERWSQSYRIAGRNHAGIAVAIRSECRSQSTGIRKYEDNQKNKKRKALLKYFRMVADYLRKSRFLFGIWLIEMKESYSKVIYSIWIMVRREDFIKNN